jgi:SAM-dependent methyltransferase
MQFHPESPDLDNGNLSRLRFITDVKKHLIYKAASKNREIYAERYAQPRDSQLSTEDQALRREEIREQMEGEPYFQAWSASMRASQDLLWTYVGDVVDSDKERMAERFKARAATALGSVKTNDQIEIPEYLAGHDTHRMPGSYFGQEGDNDLYAGAVYDLGGAMYQLGIGNSSGALLNDSRGRTLVSHLRQYYPAFTPTRILDMGCSAGHNTIPLCIAFPEAEVHAIDIGAGMVRYAHLRAEGLGAKVHFSQQNMENTDFADDSFDLVVSQIVFHETSPEATKRIIAESVRILKPGGVLVHLEVPLRYEYFDVFDQFFRSWEQYYNAEANIVGAAVEDFGKDFQDLGIKKILIGFQPIPPAGSDAAATMSNAPIAGHGTWYIASGVKEG